MQTRDGAAQAERALVRACSAGLDVVSLRTEVLRAVRRLMPVDAAFFATADPQTLLFTSAYAEEPLAAASAEFLDNEFRCADVNRFTALTRSPSPVASLDAATRADRWASPRYREIMRPLGLGDELRAALLVDGDCWGYLCLHRADTTLGFTPSETALLARLGRHIASGLRSALLFAGPRRPGDERPGVVVLSEDLDVVAVTPEAERLLDLLPGTLHLGRPLPAAVPAVAQALLAQERAGGTARVPSVRVPTPSGRWVLVSASRLHGPPGERRVSVVLAPAPPADTVPLLLSAHGLTAREAEVARLVLRGASTRAMGEALHISRYTVQDHLKAVFDKVGVRSRGELAVRLLGQR